jgi:2,4-dienoyl-CoA reductase (NADPH2)
MGSMHTGLEETGMFSGLFGGGKLDNMAEYFVERARGGVGLMVTGGIAPNYAGQVLLGAAKMSTQKEADRHRVVTDAVHAADGRIAMQILHAGRYAYHFWPVSASAVKSPISWYKPKALSSREIEQTIDDFVKCAVFAKSAGYDGVEIMGSEGYLINQFLVRVTSRKGVAINSRLKVALSVAVTHDNMRADR